MLVALPYRSERQGGQLVEPHEVAQQATVTETGTVKRGKVMLTKRSWGSLRLWLAGKNKSRRGTAPATTRTILAGLLAKLDGGQIHDLSQIKKRRRC